LWLRVVRVVVVEIPVLLVEVGVAQGVIALPQGHLVAAHLLKIH
jgi:hypothetical protein